MYSISNVSSYKVGSIIREINPEILLYLPDITQVELSTALLRLREGETYASHSVIPHMRNEISSGRCVDITDRRILYFLGQGARTKDLPRLIALSLPSIEKRKRLLKHLLNEPENDYQLILAARRQGLI